MDELQSNLVNQNPWWEGNELPEETGLDYHRMFLHPVGANVFSDGPRRSLLVFGQRRAGKTVMLKQMLGLAIENNLVKREHACYVDLGAVFTSGRILKDIVRAFKKLPSVGDGRKLLVFDEIQFASDWPIQIKTMTDHEKDTAIVVSGSVSAVLHPKHRESGYGRFLDMYVPPFLFCEYLLANGKWPTGLPRDPDGLRDHRMDDSSIESLNDSFLEYINHGAFLDLLNFGYSPEAIQRVKRDAVDRAIIRDIPMHYGIRKLEALQTIFMHIAQNNGRELKRNNIAMVSGLDKETVDSYLDYLREAFLVRTVYRSSNKLKRLQISAGTKYMLEHASHSSVLHGNPKPTHADFGHIAEATVFSQTLPPAENEINYVHYNREDKDYEIDMVHRRGRSEVVTRLAEVKWGDNETNLKTAARNLIHFAGKLQDDEHLDGCYCTTRSTYPDGLDDTGRVRFMPTAQYCLLLGMEIFRQDDVYSLKWKPARTRSAKRARQLKLV